MSWVGKEGQQLDSAVLDHVIILKERHLRRVLRSYVDYYHDWRTHLSLEMDAPASRAVQPPELGPVRKQPEVDGIHHHYERIFLTAP